MKKLLFIIILISLTSCGDSFKKYTTEKNQKQITSIDIVEAAEKDSVLFKRVVIDNHIYFVNNKSKLVENSIKENEHDFIIFVLFLFLFAFVFLLGVRIGAE